MGILKGRSKQGLRTGGTSLVNSPKVASRTGLPEKAISFGHEIDQKE
jgi:hypothetical protein